VRKSFVNVRLWPPSDTCIWAPSFWSRRIFSWNFSKATGLPWNRLGPQRAYQ